MTSVTHKLMVSKSATPRKLLTWTQLLYFCPFNGYLCICMYKVIPQAYAPKWTHISLTPSLVHLLSILMVIVKKCIQLNSFSSPYYWNTVKIYVQPSLLLDVVVGLSSSGCNRRVSNILYLFPKQSPCSFVLLFFQLEGKRQNWLL